MRTARLDTAFNPNASDTAYAIAVQADGKILVGGEFITFAPNNGAPVTRYSIARLNPSGTLDTAFDPNANGAVTTIAVQADGKILASGGFTTLAPNNGAEVTRNYIARLNHTGTLDTAFNPNASDFVGSIALQADGKILAGGDFSGANSIGGQTRNRIARLDATTGVADSFDPNANGFVESIALQADGKILAGGLFNGANSIGGQTRNRIARLDGTIERADSFNPNADSNVFGVAMQADGKILVGGGFASIGGQPRSLLLV